MRRLSKYLKPNSGENWDDNYRRAIGTGRIRSDGEHLLKFTHLFDRSRRILDFGSGPGGNVQFLARRLGNRDFTLVDQSRVSLDYARDRLLGEKDNRGNTFSFREDVEDVPENSVDMVMSIQVLEHITDYRLVMDSLWRRIVPGGVMLISVPVRGIRDTNRQHVNKFTVRRMFLELCRYGETVHISPRTWSRRSGRLTTSYFYLEKAI